MLLAVDPTKSSGLIEMPGGAQHAVGPQGDLPVARLTGEANALGHQALTDAEPARLRLDQEQPELRRVQLVAPTSTEERIRAAAEATDGWLYLVSVTGTTGARSQVSPSLPPLVKRVRAVSDVPVYAGFGISTPEHARAVAELADGVVVGSRAVETAEEGPEALRDYVASLRTALDS